MSTGFLDVEGEPLGGIVLSKLADAFRDFLAASGVDRPQLFARTDERNPIRAHDLPGTFVSVNLANGKTERWVMRRTGHTSSQMLSVYDDVVDEKVGRRLPLDRAIPELLRWQSERQQTASEGLTGGSGRAKKAGKYG